MPDMISVSEAAAILGISERQVGRHRASGKLPFIKNDDGNIRINRRHIELLAPRAAPRKPAAPAMISDDARELPPGLLRSTRRSAGQ
jgi:hypothetical protein